MKTKRLLSLLMAVVMLLGMVASVRAETEVATVDSVTEQLEAIDTLQQIQNNRSKYTASGHYDYTTTTQKYIDSHLSAQANYETYVTTMLAARAAAKDAYESLSPEEQAQIDPALVAKLDDTLETKFLPVTNSVSGRDDAYIYEVPAGTLGLAYEVSTHMAGAEIPQTFVLVDTSDGKTEWTPNGLYSYGESNYEVTYCCDYSQGLVWGSDYRRLNLEDATYFSDACAEHIRAIVLNSYPYISIEEMKENLKAGGMNPDFVDSLTRSDIIAAVQMSIWRYSNSELISENAAGYTATISVEKNTGVYFTPLHDYTNEIWDWLPKKQQRTYYSDASYRINNLIYYLCNLEGVKAPEGSMVISEVKIGRADIVPASDDLYMVGLHIILNEGSQGGDNVTLNIVSYSTDESGNVKRTSSKSIKVGEEKEYALTINARYGDTIEVYAEGTQELEKSVYFYEAEGGSKASQSLVGIAEGSTPVFASESFTFERDIEGGLRIYKKSSEDKSPISDITFHVYNVENEEGKVFDEDPTEEEIAKYAVAENLVGSVVTDSTGYAALELPEGTYLVVEEHNAEKVEKPVDPFYVTIPFPTEVEVETENGVETVIEYLDIVSLYPKNTPTTPPPPPPPPPPGDIYGRFRIIKHKSGDTETLLEGAEFTVYRAADDDDTDVETVTCDGKKINVVPVIKDGETVNLITDKDGSAISPDLDLGTYYVKETKAPRGYVLADEVFAVSVTSREIQEESYLYVPNESAFLLPETGGSGTFILSALGASAVVIAGIFLAVNKMTKNRQRG